jgi:hypothetical protein
MYHAPLLKSPELLSEPKDGGERSPAASKLGYGRATFDGTNDFRIFTVKNPRRQMSLEMDYS